MINNHRAPHEVLTLINDNQRRFNKILPYFLVIRVI